MFFLLASASSTFLRPSKSFVITIGPGKGDWLRAPWGRRGTSVVSQDGLAPVPGVLCGSLSTVEEEDSWLSWN